MSILLNRHLISPNLVIIYVGDGEVTWVEIGGEGVPTNWDGYGNNF